MSFDPRKVRQDFPIFERTIRDGKKLIYLDSGATSHKPNSVIEAKVISIACTMRRFTEAHTS